MKVRDVMTKQTAFFGPDVNLAQSARYAKKNMGSCVRRIRQTATLCEKHGKPTNDLLRLNGAIRKRVGGARLGLSRPSSNDE